MDEQSLRAPDDVAVFYRRWLPSGPVRGALLLAHGLSEHSGRYARFADVLTDAGFAVYAPDHRGHGRTASSTGLGRAGPRGFEGILGDIALLERRAREETGRNVVLFGHSMGSVIALGFAERQGSTLSGLVLSGTSGPSEVMAGMIEGVRAAVDAGKGDEPLPMLGGTGQEDIENARTPYDWLSRDADEVDRYIADPLCGDACPPTYAFLLGMMQLGLEVMEPDAIASLPPGLPVLLIAGEKDPASANAAQVRELEARMRRTGLDVRAHYYAEARHELLNELNRNEVHHDVLAWLDTIPPGPR